MHAQRVSSMTCPPQHGCDRCCLDVQVHRATLNGEDVVIKVQRPGLRELFEVDLRNIRVLAVWLQAADPKSDGAARDWVAIYDECSKILYEVRCDDSAWRFSVCALETLPEQRSSHAFL